MSDYLSCGSPDSVKFVLSLHTDVPDSVSPTGYSMPGDVVRARVFLPGDFTARIWSDKVFEGWMDPPDIYQVAGDSTCWQTTVPGT